MKPTPRRTVAGSIVLCLAALSGATPIACANSPTVTVALSLDAGHHAGRKGRHGALRR